MTCAAYVGVYVCSLCVYVCGEGESIHTYRDCDKCAKAFIESTLPIPVASLMKHGVLHNTPCRVDESAGCILHVVNRECRGGARCSKLFYCYQPG